MHAPRKQNTAYERVEKGLSGNGIEDNGEWLQLTWSIWRKNAIVQSINLYDEYTLIKMAGSKAKEKQKLLDKVKLSVGTAAC